MMKYILISATLLVLVSCSSVRTVKFDRKTEQAGLIYTLPENVVLVEMEITEFTTVPGPYQAYAQKYLGIQGAPSKQTTRFEISGVNISLTAQPDTSCQFVLMSRGCRSATNFNFSEAGTLCSVNSDILCEKYDQPSYDFILDNQRLPDILFIELSQSDYLKEKIDTIYKMVKVDTSFVRVPVQKKELIEASEEDKAKEAAHHILRLRKRMFKLLTGAYDTMPDSDMAKVIIEEMNKEEEEYLSLFIGKSFVIKRKVIFSYIPSSERAGKQEVLAFFDPSKGLTGTKSAGSKAITMDFNTMENLYFQDTLPQKNKPKGLAYRKPAQTKFRVYEGSSVIQQIQLPIAQLGRICYLPKKKYVTRKRILVFNPVSGDLIKTEVKSTK